HDVRADPLGARPGARAVRAAVADQASDPRHRGGGRPSRSRAGAAGDEGGPERDRLRPAAAAPAVHRARPAGGRPATDADSRGLRRDGGERRGDVSWRRANRRAARQAGARRTTEEELTMATHIAPTPAPEPLETHAEWRARDVADRSRWTYRLSDAEVAE